MKVYSEMSLCDFEFWSGATDLARKLTYEQFNEIEAALEDAYPDGMSETEINDLFWFEADYLANLLGYESEEDLCNDEEE